MIFKDSLQSNQLKSSSFEFISCQIDTILQLQQQEEKLKCCDVGLKINLRDFRVIHQKRVILIFVDKNTDALEFFEHALRINPFCKEEQDGRD